MIPPGASTGFIFTDLPVVLVLDVLVPACRFVPVVVGPFVIVSVPLPSSLAWDSVGVSVLASVMVVLSGAVLVGPEDIRMSSMTSGQNKHTVGF